MRSTQRLHAGEVVSKRAHMSALRTAIVCSRRTARLARVSSIAAKPAKSRGRLLLLLLVVLLAKTTSTAKSKGHSGWLTGWQAALLRLVDPVRGG